METNVADLLTARATAMPQTVAVIHGDRSLTLGALDRAVWSMTRKIHNAGIRPGDRVGLQARDPLLHLIATFALARLGIVQLAVSPDASAADQNADLLRRVGASAVVSDRQNQDDPVRPLVAIDLETTLAGNGDPDPALRQDGGDRPLMFKSSSGTTGKPKLVGASHKGMIASIVREQSAIGYLVDERYLTSVALQFDAPKRRYLACIVSGSTAVMPPATLSIEGLLDLFERHGIRHFSCVPRQAEEIALALPPGRQRLPNIRCLRLSAAPSDARLLDLLRERICSNIVLSYGCTELGPMTFAEPQVTTGDSPSVGRPMPGIDIEIVSADGHPVPTGNTGVVRVRAVGMPNRYLDDPEASARHFRNGWFYPGDLGTMSTDGELTLMGRADDIMIFDGINIAPKEIELVLQAYPGVREVAAFPLRSRKSYQMPAAAVILEEGADLDDLNRFARTRLGSRAPILIISVNDMPRNQGGKIVKRVLSELAEKHLESTSGRPL